MSWCNGRRSLDRSHVCERDKWSDNKLCRLVCLYERFPCLWKKDNPSYMDNSRRHCAYGNIHQGMEMPNVTFTEVMIKIRELRRAYVEELKKILMARKAGRRYEPRQKWFLSLHKFLYEHLDFDEVAELQDPEDSSSSCYRRDCEEDEGSQYLDTDSDCNADSSFDESGTFRSKRSPRISCNFSRVGTSTMKTGHENSNHCSSRGKDPCKKVIECPHREYTKGSKFCNTIRQTPRSKKSNSVTIICEKKTDVECPFNDDANCNAERKFSVCNGKAASSSPSGPKTSSVDGFDSYDSMVNDQDEFDVFAKSVACQLRKMDTESAVLAQNQIQNYLTGQRLRRSQPIRPETSETKDLGVEVPELSSPQQSATRIRSRMIKPAMSKRLLAIMNPSIRTSELRTISRRSDPTPQRKTKRNSLK